MNSRVQLYCLLYVDVDATYITTIVQFVQSSALTPRGNYQQTNLIECSSHIGTATNTG